MVRTQGTEPVWIGVDWGNSTHAVCVVDNERAVLEQFTVGSSIKELDALAQRLEGFGRIGGIAIESTANPILHVLFSKGFPIYPINPKLSKNWRDGASVAGSKSDARDGRMLAVELARRHESLRPLTESDPAVAELSAMCENLRRLIDERTALVQRLKATLGHYYPAALEFFGDWTSPAAWRFLKRFPQPETFARAKKHTLIKFLKANRIGLTPNWLNRIEERTTGGAWPTPPDAGASEVMALATVAQLQALQAHIDKCDKRIENQVRALPQYELARSLPGAGERLAPALTAIAATMASEDDPYQGLRCLAGVAPVDETSGKRKRVRIRRRCNKHWREVMHLFAYCSIRASPWAHAFYTLRREQGDTHAGALRKLADKWIKILAKMLATGETYDEQRYMQALRGSGSPVYDRLAQQACA